MIDIIGKLYDPATYDEAGNQITPATPLPGYHVNAIELTSELEPYLIEPATPRRVFAGQKTYCLQFSDRAEWLALGLETTDVDGNTFIDTTSIEAAYKKKIKRTGMEAGPLQIRKALRMMGELDTIKSYMETADEEIKEAWEHASVFKRSDPMVLGVQQLLQKTDDEIDQLFELAVSL